MPCGIKFYSLVDSRVGKVSFVNSKSNFSGRVRLVDANYCNVLTPKLCQKYIPAEIYKFVAFSTLGAKVAEYIEEFDRPPNQESEDLSGVAGFLKGGRRRG